MIKFHFLFLLLKWIFIISLLLEKSSMDILLNIYFCVLWKKGRIYVTLEHKTSHKSLGYIYRNSQQYIVWVKMIDFSFMLKNH